jgi:hypothetical protein
LSRWLRFPVTAWVGANERPEFVRQNRALFDMWRGFETPMAIVEEAGRHHFDVIDGLGRSLSIRSAKRSSVLSIEPGLRRAFCPD